MKSPESSTNTTGPANTPSFKIGGAYSKYALFLLVIVSILNFVDRQILSILAQEIKADLGISDGHIGFLYGTAFAIFYAIFGIPFGRLADIWVRKRLMSIGLFVWSAMTALSGLSRSFAALAGFRVGVGIGEATASPAAFSLLSDYFAPSQRATVIAIYSAGLPIGAGLGLFIGGLVLESWKLWYPDVSGAPFGLKGWQVAFFVVGLPGIIFALLVAKLKEPPRGISEGLHASNHPTPFRESFKELVALLPVANLHGLIRAGKQTIISNMVILLLIICCVSLLIKVTGDMAQWCILGFGVYAATCWVQNLKNSDPVAYGMIFQCKSMRYLLCGFPIFTFVSYGFPFWIPSFYQRFHGISPAETGTIVGLSMVVGGCLGTILGGVFADLLRKKFARGRFYVCFATVVIGLPSAAGLVLIENLSLSYVCLFIYTLTASMWVGSAVSTITDLVIPRMRATASAFYLLTLTLVGLSLGPYSIGQISDWLSVSETVAGGGLKTAMLIGLLPQILGLVFLILSARHLPADEASRIERATSLGEPTA
jgi:MFS family permease